MRVDIDDVNQLESLLEQADPTKDDSRPTTPAASFRKLVFSDSPKNSTATKQAPRFADRFAQKQPQLKKPTLPLPKPAQLNLCQEHGRPADLICLDDRQRVCAHCALFGQHKGHDVREQ
jgi:B-box zinc finger